ncbi:VanW family protein [Nonomuraea sp. NPDC049129]|uniref:VanW family protein n=1 Tax=Nonomuraea sp. NPDC049129 TaxID=3155272 RepID=UPI0033FE468A
MNRSTSTQPSPPVSRSGSRRALRSRRARLAVVVTAVIAVPVLAYALPAIALAGEVPPGTRVDNVDIGGLSPAEARSRLEREFGKRTALPLALVAVGKTRRVTPTDLGLAFDAEATVRAALDGATTPAGILRSLFGSRQLQPTVTVDEQRLTTKLADLAKSIDATPREGTVRYRGLEPQVVRPKAGRALDREAAGRAIRAAFTSKRQSVDLQVRALPPQRPRDASFKISNGKPQIIHARVGRGIDVNALGTAISATLAAGGRRVDVPVAQTQPRVTTEAAKKLGIKEKVSSFTTRHPCCAPRVTNIHRIADIVDGYVVKPGETFSLNGLVGKRDKARGFVEAPMILNNRFVNDVGGGVSQFATTMFNAVFFGGFQDVQHTPHQYYISRYPAGRESTVSFPQPDFRWRNDSRTAC